MPGVFQAEECWAGEYMLSELEQEIAEETEARREFSRITTDFKWELTQRREEAKARRKIKAEPLINAD